MDEKRESRESLFNYTILSPFEMEENSRSVSRGGGTMARSLCSSRLGCRVENTRRGERAVGNTDRFLMTRDWWLFERSGEGAGATTTNRTRDWILLRTRSRFTSYLVSSWKPIFVLSRFVGKVHFLRGGRNNEVQTERSVGRKIKLERKK